MLADANSTPASVPAALASPPSPPPLPPFVLKDDSTYFNDMKKAFIDGGYASYEEVYLSTAGACMQSTLQNELKNAGQSDVAEIHIPALKHYFTKIYPIVFSDEVVLQNSTLESFTSIAQRTAKELVNQCSKFSKVVKQSIKDYLNRGKAPKPGRK